MCMYYAILVAIVALLDGNESLDFNQTKFTYWGVGATAVRVVTCSQLSPWQVSEELDCMLTRDKKAGDLTDSRSL